MTRARHREEQLIGVLEQAQAGSTIEELCRRRGISAATYYEWKQKFGSQEVNDAQRLRLLEEENRNLKELVADQHPRYGYWHIPRGSCAVTGSRSIPSERQQAHAP